MFGICGTLAGRATSTGAAGLSLTSGEQHSHTEAQDFTPVFIAEQADASLANDATKIAARAIKGRRNWRGFEVTG